MNKFINAVQKITTSGMAGGAALMVALMVLTVANVIYRAFGGVIQGTYELSEILIAVCAGFALSYTIFNDRNVAVKLLTSRLSNRMQSIFEGFNALLGVGIWGAMSWMTVHYLIKRGFKGEGFTETLEFPYFPVKCLWAAALILCVIVFVVKFISAFQKKEDK